MRIAANFCPECGLPVWGIIGEDDDCVHCGVWWHDKCRKVWLDKQSTHEGLGKTPDLVGPK